MKKPMITIDDFLKLDIRVGEVKEAINIEGSTKLVSLMVDFGEEYGTVEILTGMQAWYTPEDFLGKKFLFLVNLEPRAMMGHTSNGMLMATDINGTPTLNTVDDSIENGTPVK